MALARTGDAAAWADLYRLHGPRLVAWLRTRHIADAAICAEDLAAEAWAVTAAKIEHFVGDQVQFGGWLFVIAQRQASTCSRRSARRTTDPLEPERMIDVAGAVAASGGDPRWVRAVLDALPPRERAAVALVDALGLDASGAAEMLGTTANAVRVARHRGIRRLRAARCLEARHEP